MAVIKFIEEASFCPFSNHRLAIKTIPESWLDSDPFFANHDAHREAYQAYLLDRLAASHYFVEEALRARTQFL